MKITIIDENENILLEDEADEIAVVTNNRTYLRCTGEFIIFAMHLLEEKVEKEMGNIGLRILEKTKDCFKEMRGNKNGKKS